VTSNDALISYPEMFLQYGLVVSTLGLRFTVTSDHFVGGSMKIRCVAIVLPTMWQEDREDVVQTVPPFTEKNIRDTQILGTAVY